MLKTFPPPPSTTIGQYLSHKFFNAYFFFYYISICSFADILYFLYIPCMLPSRFSYSPPHFTTLKIAEKIKTNGFIIKFKNRFLNQFFFFRTGLDWEEWKQREIKQINQEDSCVLFSARSHSEKRQLVSSCPSVLPSIRLSTCLRETASLSQDTLSWNLAFHVSY